MTDKNAQAQAIIDYMIAHLKLLGFESADDAAHLMAIQSIIRIACPDKRKAVAAFACEMAEDESEGEP